MATWATPSTWVFNATITEGALNTEIRDHLIWLKAALDLITNGTTGDSGDATYLRIMRSTAALSAGTHYALIASITGDVIYRVLLNASGKLEVGDGASPRDTNLYRIVTSSGEPGRWKTDNHFYAENGLATRMVSGPVTDSSFQGVTPPSGTFALDTLNSRVVFKFPSGYRYVATTAQP